jgi:hypothetical protein
MSFNAAEAHAHPFTDLPLPQSLQHERERLFSAWGKANHGYYTARFLKKYVQHFKGVSRTQDFADTRAIHVYGFNFDKQFLRSGF